MFKTNLTFLSRVQSLCSTIYYTIFYLIHKNAIYVIIVASGKVAWLLPANNKLQDYRSFTERKFRVLSNPNDFSLTSKTQTYR